MPLWNREKGRGFNQHDRTLLVSVTNQLVSIADKTIRFLITQCTERVDRGFRFTEVSHAEHSSKLDLLTRTISQRMDALEAKIAAVEKAITTRHQVFTFKVRGPIQKKGSSHMPLDLTCSTEEKFIVTLSPTTLKGAPTSLDGPPDVTVISGPGTASVNPDGNIEVLTSDTDLSDTTFLVGGDSDLGAGVVRIEDTIVLHATNPLAKNLGLAAGGPVPK